MVAPKAVISFRAKWGCVFPTVAALAGSTYLVGCDSGRISPTATPQAPLPVVLRPRDLTVNTTARQLTYQGEKLHFHVHSSQGPSCRYACDSCARKAPAQQKRDVSLGLDTPHAVLGGTLLRGDFEVGIIHRGAAYFFGHVSIS